MKRWQIDFTNDWQKPWTGFRLIEISIEDIFGKELFIGFMGLGVIVTLYTKRNCELLETFKREHEEIGL